jgi:hypothetical protein
MTHYDTSNITVADLANHLRTEVFSKMGDKVSAYANVLNDTNVIDVYAVFKYGRPVFMTLDQFKFLANAQQFLARH